MSGQRRVVVTGVADSPVAELAHDVVDLGFADEVSVVQTRFPTATLVVGGALGIVGFFVIPVVGLPLGFVGGVYLAELNRTSHEEAWPATVHALKAVGLGILIELVFSVVAAVVWVIGVVAVS